MEVIGLSSAGLSLLTPEDHTGKLLRGRPIKGISQVGITDSISGIMMVTSMTRPSSSSQNTCLQCGTYDGRECDNFGTNVSLVIV